MAPEFVPSVQFTRAADGASIAYAVWPGSSPPWISANTPGAAALSLRNRLPGFPPVGSPSFGRSVVVFDWRGTGQSSPTPPASLDDLVLDLAAVTDAVGEEAPDVVSFGLSCFPVCLYAARNPGRWRSLLLSDPSVRADDNVQTFLGRPGWETDYVTQIKVIIRFHLGSLFGEDIDALAAEWARGVPYITFAAFRAVEAGADLTEVLPGVQLPVVITDSMGSPDARVAALLPNAVYTPVVRSPTGPAFFKTWQQGIGHLLPLDQSPAAALTGPLPSSLSEREWEVLALVASGASNRAIAERLSVSQATVATHVRHILEKTGSPNRAAATRWAIEHGVG